MIIKENRIEEEIQRIDFLITNYPTHKHHDVWIAVHRALRWILMEATTPPSEVWPLTYQESKK